MGQNKKRSAPSADQPAQKQKKAKQSLSIANIKPGTFVEYPERGERKREADLYELLSSIDENDRTDAAEFIISTLLGKDGEDGVDEPVLERHLFRRLLRGLASGRKAARVGFSLVLTEVLKQLYVEKKLVESKYPGLTFEKLWKGYLEATQTNNEMLGQEERDHTYGRLFGMYAFVRSGALFTDPSRWDPALNVLLSLGQKKAWMRSQCGFTIMGALRQMPESQVRFTLQRMADKGQARTPEGVAVWLAASSQYPDLKVQPWGHPLEDKSLKTLTAVLKESYQQANEDDEFEVGGKSKQAGWTKDPHFVWDLIQRYYALDELASVADFERFWKTVIDDGFFSAKATDGQKFSGFMIFQKMLRALAAGQESLCGEKLQCLFSKNLLECLMNQASQADRFVHRAAIHTLKAIDEAVASKPALLSKVLSRLLGVFGTYNFDQRTNTKTVDKLLRFISRGNDGEVLQAITEPLVKLQAVKSLQANDKAIKPAQQTVRAYVDYLSKSLNTMLVDLATNSDAETFRKSGTLAAMKDLGTLAYSESKLVPANVMSTTLRELCQIRLESLLAKLAKFKGQYEMFCTAVAELDPGSKDMEEEIADAKKDALAQMKKLLKRKSSEVDGQQSLPHGLAMLYAVSIFRLYNEDADALEVLTDLKEHASQKSVLDSESGSSEVLVEILLSMVTRPSSLMREVSRQVFEALTSQLSEDALKLLTEPLTATESAKGQQELFDTAGDMDVDEDDEDDEEGDSDAEDVEDVEDASDMEFDGDMQFVAINGEGADDDDDDEEDDDSEEEDEDDDTPDQQSKEYQELDKAIGAILGSHRLDKDGEAESGSDEDMSDSEMLELDEKLTEVFKQRVKARPDSKKEKREAKQTVINFKNRILDLLDIYVKNEAGNNPLAFGIILPLLHLMRTTSTKQLASHAHNVILDFKKGKKKARGGNKKTKQQQSVDAEKLLVLLGEIHEEARKDDAQAFVKAASTAGLRVASAIVAADRGMHEKIISLYSKTLVPWPQGKGRSTFQSDWNSWAPPPVAQ